MWKFLYIFKKYCCMCDHVCNMQRILNHTYRLTLTCITNLASSLWFSNNHKHNQLKTQREEALLLYILKLILECQPCHHSQDSVRYSKKFNMLLYPEVCYLVHEWMYAWRNFLYSLEHYLSRTSISAVNEYFVICAVGILCSLNIHSLGASYHKQHDFA